MFFEAAIKNKCFFYPLLFCQAVSSEGFYDFLFDLYVREEDRKKRIKRGQQSVKKCVPSCILFFLSFRFLAHLISVLLILVWLLDFYKVC